MEAETDTQTSTPATELVHTVTPSDSLERISLLYGVSIASLKQRNRIYNTTTLLQKTVIVPNPTRTHAQHANPEPAVTQRTRNDTTCELLASVDVEIKSILDGYKLPKYNSLYPPGFVKKPQYQPYGK